MIGNMRQENCRRDDGTNKNAINNWERVEIAAHYLNTALESARDSRKKRQ